MGCLTLILCLLVQNCLHSRRQQIVARSAAKSARIVANLFPEFARNQLFGRGTQKSNVSSNNLSSDVAGDMANAAKNRTRPSPVRNEYDEEAPPDRGGDAAAVGSSLRSFDSGENSAVEGSGGKRAKGLKIKVSDFVDTPATKLRRFLAQPAPTKEDDSHINAEIGLHEPIAEVFEKTTVMLADIDGFTAWW